MTVEFAIISPNSSVLATVTDLKDTKDGITYYSKLIS
jgi:hypothetical protein